MPHHRIVAVTVTYGDRIGLLRDALRSMFANPEVTGAVVVSNNSTSTLDEIESEWQDRSFRIIRLTTNTGSANGFAVGIEAALDLNPTHVWLLDDDNAPRQDAAAILLDELEMLSARDGNSHTAVCCFRPAQLASVRALNESTPGSLKSEFMGFHVAKLAKRLGTRFSPRKGREAAATAHQDAPLKLSHATYGGFLASVETYRYIGLPNSDLVLYMDDTEYTQRLIKMGGQIWMVPRAIVDDLEVSWNDNSLKFNRYSRLLKSRVDSRLYYSVRNQAWMSRDAETDGPILYHLNRFLFLSILRIMSLVYRAGPQLRVVERAIRDGESGNMGLNPAFPI